MNLSSNKPLCALLAVASFTSLFAGCDLGDSACEPTLADYSGAFIKSDDGSHTAAARCGEGICGLSAVLRGAPLTLIVDLMENGLPTDASFKTLTPDTLRIDETERWEECNDSKGIRAEAVFQAPGEAAVSVFDGEERARFTFRVYEAASLELAVRPNDSENAVPETSVLAKRGTSVLVQPIVENADGERLATGDEVRFSIDEIEIAEVTKSSASSSENAAMYGGEQVVSFKRLGTTLLRAQLGDMIAMLDIVVTANPDDKGGISNGGEGMACVTGVMNASNGELDEACAECLCDMGEAAANDCTETSDCWSAHACAVDECAAPDDYACLSHACSPPRTAENEDAVEGVQDAINACFGEGLCQ